MSAANKACKKNITDRLILGMGVAYLLFLIWAVLWKCGRPFIGDGAERTINLLPFNDNTRWEMEYNVAVFVPAGFYLSAAMKKVALFKQVLVILIISFMLETFQFVLAIGQSDITDLLMNTLGGAIGIAAFYVLLKLLKKKERKVTLVICILLTLFELYMTISFIFLGYMNIGYMIVML